MRRRVATLLALLAVGAAACTTSALDAAEDELRTGFLDPLASAGVDVELEETCRLDLDAVPETAPWHLEARMVADAELGEVADVLEAEDMVLRRDRDPMIVQQVRGAPAEGWNGIVEETDAGVVIAVTRNGVDVADPDDAAGWDRPCRR